MLGSLFIGIDGSDLGDAEVQAGFIATIASTTTTGDVVGSVDDCGSASSDTREHHLSKTLTDFTILRRHCLSKS